MRGFHWGLFYIYTIIRNNLFMNICKSISVFVILFVIPFVIPYTHHQQDRDHILNEINSYT